MPTKKTVVRSRTRVQSSDRRNGTTISVCEVSEALSALTNGKAAIIDGMQA